MELKYKPDWETAKEHYITWWAHEYFGRCAINIYAPKEGVKREPPPLPEKVEDRWLDFDYLTAVNDYRMASTYYGGEAFPMWSPGYAGQEGHPRFLGSEVKLMETTGWGYPVIEDGDLTSHDYNDIKLDKDGEAWQYFVNVRKRAVRDSKGKGIPGNNALGGCGDTLAAIRTTNKLLFDVTECPDYVRAFDQYLMKQWIEVYEESYNLTREGAEGSTCFYDLWSPGRFYCTHNDFAYMISPEMFIDIFLPSIEMQIEYLDHTVYHVDGIGNFVHVDALLELEKIQAIQILPGAGKPSPLHYMDVLKKVQKAGRNLHIGIGPGEVKDALENLSARGLFIGTYAETEADAKDLLRYVEKNSVDRG